MSTPPPPPARAVDTCVSGVTDAQLKLLNLNGALQVVEWLAVEAQHAVCGPAPTGNPTLHGHLLKLQEILVRAQGLCLNSALARSAP